VKASSIFHARNQMADRVLLFGEEGVPGLEHRLLFLCQFHHAALGKELGQRDAEALADHFQRCHGWRGVAVEDVGDRGL
jgi:hypothetical protein